MPHVNSNFSGANGLIIGDAQRMIERQVFGPRRLRPFDPQAGSNITITPDALSVIIAATAGGSVADDSSSVLASRTFVNPINPALRLPGRVQVGIDGQSSVPTTGILLDFVVPANMTIIGWEVLADISGSIQFDLWKTTYTGFPPTVANTITGSDKPNLTTQQKNSSTALTGWTTSWTEGDIVRVNVDSDSVLTRALLVISYTKP